ncbi:MAG TPA: hypothetical protein VL461_06270 [Dictyobacter sp.]|jgi:hypothetical protein|nr:hypothetical protein [Dictyobacter sp.]
MLVQPNIHTEEAATLSWVSNRPGERLLNEVLARRVMQIPRRRQALHLHQRLLFTPKLGTQKGLH